ncbi:uncharacterized protein LY79DRAFT_539194 [Colletotrichum navitas]|uniref:Uncharacterized protein n=1 Tax=Colletotrichum navitas TaxID=681940 RepID=A0AAD8VAT0_9PEZI|nr:uncharacterized protein LY79DRAFT_539194 [Colletotrichum navitas]KAK1598443.1 hypothetical protein LY79DRAFT_539194 [Colletotrichum navitas]
MQLKRASFSLGPWPSYLVVRHGMLWPHDKLPSPRSRSLQSVATARSHGINVPCPLECAAYWMAHTAYSNDHTRDNFSKRSGKTGNQRLKRVASDSDVVSQTGKEKRGPHERVMNSCSSRPSYAGTGVTSIFLQPKIWTRNPGHQASQHGPSAITCLPRE